MSGGNVRHLQAQFTFSDNSYSDIIEPNKAENDAYAYMNLRYGLSNDDWMAEIYIDNVTDKRGDISNNFVFDRQRVALIRPQTVGLRYKKNF
jgi:hypothetical protein